jgi:hypothetical protein
MLTSWLASIRNKKIGVFCLAFLLLALQNLFIFKGHYLGRFRFPFDFIQSYYGMVAFWTNAVREGVFPHWMPFQSMGYPFLMSLQSGLYYPPLWVFTLSSHLTYSGQAAIVFQCLHLLFGGLGCFLWIRLLTQRVSVALLAGVAFQFFGGFYSNAEHIDIVRAYAWLPWLFYSVYIGPEQSGLSLRNWSIPLVIYCFVTASYPGNLFAQLVFVGGVSVLFLLKDLRFQKTQIWNRVKTYFSVYLLMGLGLICTSIYLFPTILGKSYLVRSTNFAMLEKWNWTHRFWPTLFSSWENSGYQVDLTMYSAFVTVPILCCFSLVSLSRLRAYWVWFLALMLSFAMAAGSASFIYRGAAALFPPLNYSRFPTSDYRGLIGFFIISIASLLVAEHSRKKAEPISWGKLLWLPLLIGIGFVFHVFKIKLVFKEWMWTAAFAGLTLLFLKKLKNEKLVFGLALLVFASGFYTVVTQTGLTWKHPGSLNHYYKEALQVDTSRPHPFVQGLKVPHASRPARKEAIPPIDYKGYLTGEYFWNGYDFILVQREEIRSSTALLDYIKRPWEPLVFSDLKQLNCSNLKSNSPTSPQVEVKQIQYGLNEISYQIKANEQFTLVENEIYFPGWQGKSSQFSQGVESQPACKGLRAWNLPRGEYEFKAQFRMPGFVTGALLSLGGLVVYFMSLAISFYRRKI